MKLPSEDVVVIKACLEHLDLGGKPPSVSRIRSKAENVEAIKTLLALLPDTLQENQVNVISRALGFQNRPERLEVIAKDLGVSRERAGAIATQGLKRLLKAAHAFQPTQTPSSPGTALSRFRGDPIDHARHLARLPEEELKRLAVKAAHSRDLDALWDISSAHLILYGSKGSKVSKRTQKNYLRGIKVLLQDWQNENLLRPSRNAGVEWIRNLETRPVLSQTSKEVLYDKRSGKPRLLSPATVALYLAAARALYRALRWARATNAHPFADVKPTKDNVKPWNKRAAYSKEEIEQLLLHAEGADKVMVLLGAHAGLRISEMSNLRWADVDFAAAELHVVEGKGGKTDSVFASDRLLTALKELGPGLAQNYVLPYRQYRARERFHKLCIEAGVTYEGKEVHGLRHAAGTRTYELFEDLARVADHLRQEDVNTARRYAKRADKVLKKGIKDL